MAWGRRRHGGRHRLGSAGLTWCGEYVTVASTLGGPAVARRGLFETLFATARHAAGATA
jgi:hypothetical protein